MQQLFSRLAAAALESPAKTAVTKGPQGTDGGFCEKVEMFSGDANRQRSKADDREYLLKIGGNAKADPGIEIDGRFQIQPQGTGLKVERFDGPGPL